MDLDTLTRSPMDITEPMTGGLSSRFDLMDPISAEEEGMKLMESVARAKSVMTPENYTKALAREKMPEKAQEGSLPTVLDALPEVLNDMDAYLEYKRKRGEQPLEHADRVYARRNAQVEENLAKSTRHMMTADDNAFQAMLEESGHKEVFDELTQMVGDPDVVKDKYVTELTLKNVGFAKDDIDSGIAEAMFRKRINAGEHEPTRNAILRWSEETTRKYERRRALPEAAIRAASRSALGVDRKFSFEEIEKLMKDDFPNLSDSERVELRRMSREHFAKAREAYAPVLGLTRRLFNTIAQEEGISTKFLTQKDEPFASVDKAIFEVGKLSDTEYDAMLAVMADAAEAHGMDAGEWYAKLGKNITRGAEELGDKAGRLPQLIQVERDLEEAKRMAENGIDRKVMVEGYDAEGNVVGYEMVSKVTGRDSLIDTFLEGDVFVDAADIEASMNERLKNPLAGATPWAASVKVLTDPEDMQRGVAGFENKYRSIVRTSKIKDWRESVARVGSENWFVDNWVYGLARSIPEMAAGATGLPGFVLVAGAQQERNMQRLRDENPGVNVDTAANRRGAALGGAAYAGLNFLQVKTLTKGMPRFQGAVAKLTGTGLVRQGVTRVAATTVAEALQETGQDLSFATAQEVLSIVDSDVTEFELTKEFVKAVKGFPEMAAAMIPFGLIGGGGSTAMKYIDSKQWEKNMQNADYRKAMGVTDEMVAEMEGLKTSEKMDYIKVKQAEVTANMKEELQKLQQLNQIGMDTDVNILADSEGNFQITDGETTLEARSPEEAAEAAMQLDPKLVEITTGPTAEAMESLTRGKMLEMRAKSAQGESANLDADPDTMNSTAPLEAVGLEQWSKTLYPKYDTGTPLGHPDVTKALIDVMATLDIKSGIRYAGGKKLRKGVLGTYNPREGVLRVATHGDVTTAAHEMAHAIEDQYIYSDARMSDATWRDDKTLPSGMLNELATIAEDHYGGGGMASALAEKGQMFSEGFAEYIRLRMQGETNYSAPTIDKWFNDTVLKANPKLEAAFTKAQEAVKRYGDQGSKKRMLGNVETGEGLKARLEQFDAVTEEVRETAITRMVEMFDPLKKIVKEAERLAGKSLPDTQNPYLIAKQKRYTHAAVATQMVEEGMLTATGESLGSKTSLKYALSTIDASERMDFTIYLWARRALKLHGKGVNPGVTLADAQVVFAELDNPRYERAANLIYEWNDNVLQYAADSSRDYAQVVEMIRENDVGDYIPLARVFKTFRKGYSAGRGSAVNGAQLVKKIKGSGRAIKDPIQSLVSNAEQLVLRSHERKILESLFDLRKFAPKMGPIINEADAQTISAANRSAADLTNEVAKALDGELSDAARELSKIIADSDQAEAMVTLWGKSYNPPNKLENPVIPIFIDGKRSFYEVDRNAYEALGGLDMYRLPKWADLTFGLPNRVWRAGTTGYSATFQMLTNPARDFRTLWQQSRSEAGFFKIMQTWSGTMLAGMAEGLSANHIQSDWSKLYNQLGLEMVTPLGQDSRYVKRVSKNLFKGRAIRALAPRNIGKYLTDLIQYSEKATRLAEMKLVGRDIGFDPSKDQLTPEIAQKLALAAREVTTDFSAGGSVGRAMNQLLPFWNAQIQGVRAHVRSYNNSAASLEGKGKVHQLLFNKFMQRGLTMSAASIVLWLRYRDEEWWKEMDESEKYTHTYIPVDAEFSPTGMDELIKIPKAFELDGFFTGAPIAALDSFYQEDPEAAVGWAEKFLGSVVPNHPVVLNYALEQEGKENYFGQTVVPPNQEVLDVDEERYRQYGPRTTKVAMKLGKMFDMSPRRIDHTIKSFFGRAGLDAVEIFGVAESDVRDFHMSRFPVLGAIMHPRGQMPYSPKSVTEFYNRRAILKAKASKENQEVKETEEGAQIRLAYEDASAALAILREVRNATSETDKRRSLERTMVEIAREANKMFDASKANRELFQDYEDDAEALKQATIKN